MNVCVMGEQGGAITPVGGGGPIATFHEGNPLRGGWSAPPGGAGTVTVLWSGSLAEDLFAAHPANWMPAGRAALDGACAALRSAGRVCLRPHARHVLSDVPSCRRFLADHQQQEIGVALSPATMLEPSMLRDVEDHLLRLFGGLAADCRMVFLEDVQDAGEACRRVPLGAGCLPAVLLRELIAMHVPPGTPLVIIDRDVDRQLSWLRLPPDR